MAIHEVLEKVHHRCSSSGLLYLESASNLYVGRDRDRDQEQLVHRSRVWLLDSVQGLNVPRGLSTLELSPPSDADECSSRTIKHINTIRAVSINT